MNTHIMYDSNKAINAYWLYNSYFFAINGSIKNNVFKFYNLHQVQNGDFLVIIDDHYMPNRNIWFNDDFIKTINNLNVSVFVVTIEKIYNSYFNETIALKNKLNEIKKLIHISSDADDCKILNNQPAKQLFSLKFSDYQKTINNNFKSKKNKILFVGQLNTIMNSPWYHRRKEIFSKLFEKGLQKNIDFVESNPNRSFDDYIKLLSDYKYVLNPLGVGNFLSMRYAETIFSNSVPIQQYSDSMTEYYDEIQNKNGIFFKNFDELEKIINNLNFYDNLYENKKLQINYLEDYLNEKKILELI